VSTLRGIPTSRAYWELRAEQVLNRVFEPEQPILVEVCEPPPSTLEPAAAAEPAEPEGQEQRHGAELRSASGRLQRRARLRSRQPSLLLAGAGVSVMLLAAMALMLLGAWNQTQQAMRQERNLLLMERLCSMGPSISTGAADAAEAHGTGQGTTADGGLPPAPPGEPWMEELASLPASSAPAADVLRVPVNATITSPAPAASASHGNGGGGGGGGGAPHLVGVVQVPGQNGSAIFQIGGSSTSAAVGESIGSSGWRLRSASGDSAVIEKGGVQRRVSISSGF